MGDMIVQRLGIRVGAPIEMAERYYSVLAAVNSISLTQRELQLLSFMAVRGSISFANVKKEFCEKYHSTVPTVTNIISKLKRMGFLVKVENRVVISSSIGLDFTNDIVFNISMKHE